MGVAATYVGVYFLVFCMVGLRAFQQKVVQANTYPMMGFVGTLIYMFEASAYFVILNSGYSYVIAGSLGAGSGVMTFVYLYNRFFHKGVPPRG